MLLSNISQLLCDTCAGCNNLITVAADVQSSLQRIVRFEHIRLVSISCHRYCKVSHCIVVLLISQCRKAWPCFNPGRSTFLRKSLTHALLLGNVFLLGTFSFQRENLQQKSDLSLKQLYVAKPDHASICCVNVFLRHHPKSKMRLLRLFWLQKESKIVTQS